jgi:meso-butanediol dehydrogenase/(S,S)-butanediol dehydrogenase/diacetyl reductase
MTEDALKLNDKIAVVTGGGAGIGEGIARCLAEEGADLAVVDVNRTNTERVAAVVKSIGRKAKAFVGDVTDRGEVDRVVREILAAFGRIDILVNNVGGEGRFYNEKPGEPYPEEKEWDDTVRLNLKSTMLMCRAVMPHMIDQQSGKIVNIASVAGRPPSGRGRPSGMSGRGAEISPMMSYGTAKAGVIQFTMTLALQLAEFSINVNCVCPGVLYTPLYERSVPRRIQATPGAEGLTPREYFDKFVAPIVPLRREQTAEDIGRAVVFFASEDARNITGQTLNVDGGMVPG